MLVLERWHIRKMKGFATKRWPACTETGTFHESRAAPACNHFFMKIQGSKNEHFQYIVYFKNNCFSLPSSLATFWFQNVHFLPDGLGIFPGGLIGIDVQ